MNMGSGCGGRPISVGCCTVTSKLTFVSPATLYDVFSLKKCNYFRMFLVLLLVSGASALCSCSEKEGWVCTGSVSALDVKTPCPAAHSATFITDDKALCSLCDERKIYDGMTVRVSTELCSCLQRCCDMIIGCPCAPSTTTTGPTPAAAPASLSAGVIVGICVGVLATIALIAAAVVFAVKKKPPHAYLPPIPDMLYNPLNESITSRASEEIEMQPQRPAETPVMKLPPRSNRGVPPERLGASAV
jgi:hypothetical protein